jgi:class 3 adenylate cyclase/tetratricopeptide (TPR) repeat protein
MNCPACAHANPAESSFCLECGRPLVQACAQCGTQLPPNAKFCNKCGAALAAVASKPTVHKQPPQAVRLAPEQAEASPADGERKTVTALFADIKGSMELIEDLDPEEARAIVDPALNLMMEAVHRYDGYVAQSTGDGIFALFGAPVAHEDHPQRALYAALRMQEELKRYSDRIRADGRLPMQVRVGVNTGEVVVRSIQTGDAQTEYTPIGHSTSLAARMQALAPIGSIATTAAVRRLCEGYFVFKDLGPTRVKGVSELINVFEVTGLGLLRTRLQRSAHRGLSKFVGRDAEMQQLRRALDLVQAGHGQIAAAVGEAGVGKSRLFFEFKTIASSNTAIAEAFSVSHGKASTYLPVIELLKDYFEITPEDDSRRRREKVTGRLLTLDRALEDTLPYLFALLGIAEGEDALAQMDEQVKRRRTQEAIKRLVLRGSLVQPVAIIFEDLHWVDDETQALLNLLADSIANARVLLLVNYRPEYRHDWGSRTYYTQLRLDPLGKESAEAMLTALLGDGHELAALKRLITEKTQGNPFFMEEMIQALFEEGALERTETVRLVKPLDQIRIPTSVQAVLTARIDRLSAEEKTLLQTLAVIGTVFSERLVRAVTRPSRRPRKDGASSGRAEILFEAEERTVRTEEPPSSGGVSKGVFARESTASARNETADDELDRMLSALQLAEFIYEQPALGGIEYTFKHALTHDVAYNSVLTERRKLLHERTAQAIEALFKNQLDEYLNELAHHFTRSGNAAKAVEYLKRAGLRAARRSGQTEAIAHFERALALLKDVPDESERVRYEADLLSRLGWSLAESRGYTAPEVETTFLRARELGAQAGQGFNIQRHAYVLFGLHQFYAQTGDHRAGHDLAQELLALAERVQHPELLWRAHFAAAETAFFAGELFSARDHLERAVALSAAPGRSGNSDTLGLLAMTLWFLGYPAQAVQRSHEAIAAAQVLRRPFSLAGAFVFGSCVHLFARKGHTAGELADAGLALVRENGFNQYSAILNCYSGFALVLRDNGAGGIRQMRDAMLAMRNIGPAATTDLAIWLADACLQAGEIDEGLRAIVEATERAMNHTQDAERHRLEGELRLARDASSAADAERCFRAALDSARRQSAKSYELRVATSLARLWQRQGKRDAARDLLAPVYAWFTEGFDTGDLQDAKALLVELGT